jgi:Methyltransferase FkbM domain
MLNRIRVWARNNIRVRKFIAFQLAPSGWFDNTIKKIDINPDFKRRIQEVVDCPDNVRIPRVANAGEIKQGKQIMHNGLKINVGSYYGPEVAQQLIANRGVHEPQEEVVFAEVLKHIKPGSTMVELGSFWAFYSMWFHSVIPQAQNFMVEPDAFNITSGIKNFSLNKMNGDFTLGFVGDKMDYSTKPRMICVDGLCKEKKIEFIDILHCDIQGFEYDMLVGASEMISKDKIGYFFISTHSNDVHEACKELLLKQGYIIVAAYNLSEAYSDDGLIVAKSKSYSGPSNVITSLKPNPI